MVFVLLRLKIATRFSGCRELGGIVGFFLRIREGGMIALRKGRRRHRRVRPRCDERFIAFRSKGGSTKGGKVVFHFVGGSRSHRHGSAGRQQEKSKSKRELHDESENNVSMDRQRLER